MPKKFKIILQLSQKDREGYENPNFELDSDYYRLPSDLYNLTDSQKGDIINQIRIDMDMSSDRLDPGSYEVTYSGSTLFVLPR